MGKVGNAGWRQALLHRALPGRYGATAAGREWAYDRLLDLAQKHAEVTGHDDPFTLRAATLVPLVLFRGFTGWTRAGEGFQTTSDLAAILDGVGETIFVDAYTDTVRSFTAWTTAITVADFKATIASVATFPALEEIQEHGEYTAGSPFGPAVPVRLTRFGRVVEFAREAVLRDDVPSFGQLQAALGVAAAHVEPDAVYDLVVSNPTMSDGQPLFSTAHSNLMPAAALDATSLAAACAVLAANSNHGRPAFLLVGITGILATGWVTVVHAEPDWFREWRPRYERGHDRGVPPGYLPPPGACRIWFPGRPPGHQPPPGNCEELQWRVPPGARLIYGG